MAVTYTRGGNAAQTLTDYLNAGANHPVLTTEQEMALGHRIAAGREAQARLDSGEQLEFAERRQLRRTVVDGQNARTEFARCNIKLVVHIVKRRYPNSSPEDKLDMIQEGNVGLLRAVDKYSPTRGTRFSTMATWWIRQAIQRAQQADGGATHVPASLVAQNTRVWRAEDRLQQRLGREPTVAETAAEAYLTPDEVRDAKHGTQWALSLDGTWTGDETSTLSAVIPDPNAVDAEAAAEAAEVTETLEAALDGLTADEADVLRFRYGLHPDAPGVPLSIKEIAEQRDMSRTHVRLATARARSKLRHPSNDVGLFLVASEL